MKEPQVKKDRKWHLTAEIGICSVEGQTNLCTVPQSSLYDLFLQLGLHRHSSPPIHLFTTCETETLHLYSTYGFFYVTNISIINPKMPLIFNQALKFIPFESALNNDKKAIQVRNTEKYQWILK